MKKLAPALLSTLIGLATNASAESGVHGSYIVVLPATKAAAPPVNDAQVFVFLLGGAWPHASVGQPYSVDLTQHLMVIGDPGFNSAKVKWTLLQAPDGFSIVNGKLVGSFTELGANRVRVQAAYRDKVVLQDYSALVQ